MSYQKTKTYRIGEEQLQKCGLSAKIIAYPSGADMTVQFEDGRIIEHVSYYNFINGNLNYYRKDAPQDAKSYRVGEKTVCSNEMVATIIAYRSYQDIDVQFDDGVVVEHISYARFFQHSVPHPDHKPVFWPRNLKKHIGIKKRTLDGYRELIGVHEDGSDPCRRTYHSNTPIDYIDDNGTIVRNGSYHDFLTKNTTLYKYKNRRTK